MKRVILLILLCTVQISAFAKESLQPELMSRYPHPLHRVWQAVEDFRSNECGRDPFMAGEIWQGQYFCAQGWTDLKVRIVDHKEGITRAIFEFDHRETGAHGSYYMYGQYNPKSQRMTFVPGEWIVRPRGYIAVGMDGKLRGQRFEGEITYCTCGEFHVERTE